MACLLNVVLKAEFIFLLPIILKLVWFYFIHPNYTLADLQGYAPLSLMAIWQHKDIEPWYIYLLQTANLFEVIYCIALSLLLAQKLNISIRRLFVIVICSYGSGVLFWVSIVMFLGLNMS